MPKLPSGQLSRVPIKIRLRPLIADVARANAARLGMSLSGLIESLLLNTFGLEEMASVASVTLRSAPGSSGIGTGEAPIFNEEEPTSLLSGANEELERFRQRQAIDKQEEDRLASLDPRELLGGVSSSRDK